MKIDILGVGIDNLSQEEFLQQVRQYLNGNDQYYILPAAARYLVLAQHDEEYKRVLNKASLVKAEGIGLRMATSWFNHQTIPRQLTFTDLIWEVLKLAQSDKKKVYLLGADFLENTGQTIRQAAVLIKKQLPQLVIVGAEKGAALQDFKLEDAVLLKRINLAKPELLVVGFKDAYEAKWLAHNLPFLPSVKLAIGVGGAFDFMVGKQKRAPKSWRQADLEWLWRTLINPWRLYNTYVATVRFLWLVWRQKVRLK